MSQKEYRKFELMWAQKKLVEIMEHVNLVEELTPKNQELLIDAQWHVYSALMKIKSLRRNLR